MAMLQMQRISIYAMKKDRKPILEFLQRRGNIEINDMLKEDIVFHKTDVTVAKAGFDKNVLAAKEAVDILNNYVPEKKSKFSALYGRKEVSTEIYNAFRDKHEESVRIANRILRLSRDISENKAEILRLQAQVEILTPWIDLDIPMNFAGTKNTSCFIGTLPNEWTLDAIYEKLSQDMPLSIEIISASKDQTCIFVLSEKEKASTVYEALREIDFSNPSITFDKAPSEQQEYLEGLLAEAKDSMEKAKNEIISYSDCKDDLLFLQDYDSMRSEKYEIIGHLLQSKNVFVLTGYIPEIEVKTLMEDLNHRFDISVEIEQPTEDEDVPIKLDNNGFSKPLEGVLSGYSLPGKGEIDPTMVMSLFYYFLYGLMLSDAGYGFIMTIGCAVGLIKFKKTLEESMRNTLKMFLFCGISTIFWGIMFGSYFGDLLDTISGSFFGHKVSIPPLWFFPVNEPMRMLSFAMLIGLIHLLTGLGIKFYQLLKQRDYKSILYDVVTWFVLVVSSTFILLSMDMIKGILGISLTMPSFVTKLCEVLAIISAVAIVLTNGRESRNPFKRFLKGAYALYGITGYLSDVLSYSRLLALGLATSIIATVINKMASMTAGMFLGPIFFTIIIVFGHSLNISINALGSYVHTNRLQYVEFFGKFYGGGGRKFSPYGMKTKYYKIKEKM